MNAIVEVPEPHGAVLVSETGVERYQLVGRTGPAVFLMGGAINHSGLKSGPGPFDLLASALGACTAMTIRAYADRKKIPLVRVQVNVVHQRASLNSKDIFNRTIIVEGQLDSVLREKLLEVAELCPVSKSLQRGSEVITTLSPDFANASASPAVADYVQTMEQVWQEVA
jgi:putative redox protein